METGPQRHSRVCVRQYCPGIEEAARNRMELIVPEKSEAKRCDREAESR